MTGWRAILKSSERTSEVVTRRCDPSSDLYSVSVSQLHFCLSRSLLLSLAPAAPAHHGARPAPRAISIPTSTSLAIAIAIAIDIFPGVRTE